MTVINLPAVYVSGDLAQKNPINHCRSMPYRLALVYEFLWYYNSAHYYTQAHYELQLAENVNLLEV